MRIASERAYHNSIWASSSNVSLVRRLTIYLPSRSVSGGGLPLFANSPFPANKLRLSAVSQNQPLKVEIKGFKTSHFLEQKTAPRDHADAGPMGHVERPHSESASNDLQFTRQRLVPAPDRPRGHRTICGGYLHLSSPAQGISERSAGTGRTHRCI
jgi:hypothetical protein